MIQNQAVLFVICSIHSRVLRLGGNNGEEMSKVRCLKENLKKAR